METHGWPGRGTGWSCRQAVRQGWQGGQDRCEAAVIAGAMWRRFVPSQGFKGWLPLLLVGARS